MQKSSILITGLILLLTSCVSVLSGVSDEDAWNDYYKEIKLKKTQEDRSLASDPRAGIKILKQVLEGLPFRSYLIVCDHKECYQTQLALAFDQAFLRLKDQNINLNKEEYLAEQKSFLASYSYENVLNWVESFHHMILSGVELRAAQRAVDLAQLCEESNEKDDETAITNFAPFLGGNTYLPRAFYSCLNEHWLTEQDQLLKETTDRLGMTIKTDEAKRWILQRQIAPIYRKTFNDIFAKHNQEEQLVWDQSWKELESKINWKKPSEELMSVEIPKLRKQFHFLNLEAILTEKMKSKK